MWQPQLPDDPVVAGWWRNQEQRARREAVLADARQFVRIARLGARCREIDRKLESVLAAERRHRIEARSARSPRGGDDFESWLPQPWEMEHSRYVGARVLSVR